ncbi:segregation/condensation protein A [Flammeovirgaceae bacterium SG7u.111]|nr:segregation/condensation protein A [Flammeovirgaceae bacterium SG7u.132]WPO37555.1 segregation/condensation protein A [Flammeovirgaceae bacterium SG7u.111]
MEEHFEVKIPLFEGPFDLLLFFIRRDELDIHDIPISSITQDFLDYLHQLEKMNMEVASEFILVASTLMRIKAKMLLPRVEKDEEGNEIDPREELVRHLLEYKKYKSVLGELEAWEETMLQKEKRGNVVKEIKKLSETSNVDSEMEELDLYKLLKVYQQVMKRMSEVKERPIHKVTPYPYKVEEQKGYILNMLGTQERLSFEKLISLDANKIAVIFNFLAILEMLASNYIAIQIGGGYNNFWISKGEKFGEEILGSEFN